MADSQAFSKDRVVSDKSILVDYLAAGCKPREQWRIGTEHEKFAYRRDGLAPIDYEGSAGIRALLEGMSRFGWQPILEGDTVIGLKKDDGSAISLEPAGQLELSGAPLENIHQTCGEVHEHLRQVKAVAAELGIVFLGLGYRPEERTAEIPWMPKGRYRIMRAYMPTKGTLGLEMMQNTCTVQVNLDFCSEQMMVEMFRIGLALQPVATALWANSPFRQGKPSAFLSFRSHIWTDTDPDRCGILPFVFEDGFGFERYADYILDVPMYFIYRDGNYLDVSGRSFRDYLAGTLEGFEGHYPTIGDWENHLSTVFPEVRLKKFIEMRGADGGPWARLCALPAFWTGLLYDDDARSEAYDLISDFSVDEHANLRDNVPRTALSTPHRGGTLRDLALEVLTIAHGGLCRRGVTDPVGLDETHFLRPLFQIAESGLTPAEELLAAYNGRWAGAITPVFQEYAY